LSIFTTFTTFTVFTAFTAPDNGRRFSTKQVEAYAVKEEDWLVITVIVKFF
jgi:hypothetical protein